MKINCSQFEEAIDEDDQPHSKSVFNASTKDLLARLWHCEFRKSRMVEW